jgi:hypothetical protein
VLSTLLLKPVCCELRQDAAGFERPGFNATMAFVSSSMELAVDDDCAAHYEPLGELYKCSYAQYAREFVDTPLFAVQSRFDTWSLLNSVGPPSAHLYQGKGVGGTLPPVSRVLGSIQLSCMIFG